MHFQVVCWCKVWYYYHYSIVLSRLMSLICNVFNDIIHITDYIEYFV